LDAYLFGQTAARNISNLLGKVLKFVLEIRQGPEALQIIKFAKLSKEALFSFQEFKMSIL